MATAGASRRSSAAPEARGNQLVLDGIQPVRAFGVARAHVVAAAIGMAVKRRRHRSFALRFF